MSIYISKALREQYPAIVSVLEKHVVLKELDSPNLWIRDWAPVKIHGAYVKFKYKGYDGFPQLRVDYRCWAHFNARESDIFLDGGNVVQDQQTAFITEIVFKNNYQVMVNDLRQFLKDTFCKNIIYIPVEPGDDLGHADGIIKFIDEKTVLINNYRSWVSQTWYEYAIKLERVLKNNGFDFVHFPWALSKCPIMTEGEFRKKYPYADDQNEGFGYYINYYQTPLHIFMPQFGIEEDESAMRVARRHFPEHEVVPVDCSELSMLGGLMNCVTWEN
jgi:agmatine deiminase